MKDEADKPGSDRAPGDQRSTGNRVPVLWIPPLPKQGRDIECQPPFHMPGSATRIRSDSCGDLGVILSEFPKLLMIIVAPIAGPSIKR